MTRIYESCDHILICTDYADPAEHSHMAAHIIISPDRNMTVLSQDWEFSCRGVLIPSGVTHRIITHNHPVFVFLYDSTTNLAAQMKDLQTLSESDCERICRLFSEFEEKNTSDAYLFFERQFLAILGFASGCSVTDKRIISAMKQIRSGLSEPLSCQEIADSVFLSQSRFSHLFRQQVGMTFSAYLICQRLLYVYTRILSGISITAAALEAGFSSSTHFAEVNRRVFGLSASSITKKLIFTKIR